MILKRFDRLLLGRKWNKRDAALCNWLLVPSNLASSCNGGLCPLQLSHVTRSNRKSWQYEQVDIEQMPSKTFFDGRALTSTIIKDPQSAKFHSAFSCANSFCVIFVFSRGLVLFFFPLLFFCFLPFKATRRRLCSTCMMSSGAHFVYPNFGRLLAENLCLQSPILQPWILDMFLKMYFFLLSSGG